MSRIPLGQKVLTWQSLSDLTSAGPCSVQTQPASQDKVTESLGRKPHSTPSTDPASGLWGGWGAGQQMSPLQPNRVSSHPRNAAGKMCPTSSSPTFVHTFHLGPWSARARWYPRLARRNPTPRQNDRPNTMLLRPSRANLARPSSPMPQAISPALSYGVFKKTSAES